MNSSFRTVQFAGLAVVIAAAFLGGASSSPAARARCHVRYLVLVDARTGSVRGGVPSPGGEVRSAVSDGHGGWYIGGRFGYVGGVAQRTLEHLNQNGRRDQRFRVDVGVSKGEGVEVLARHGSVLYAGGHFGLAAIDAGTGKLLWSTTGDDGGGVGVSGLALANGTLYAVGTFTRIGGVLRHGVAALDPGTGRPQSWSVKVGSGGSGGALAVAVAGNTVYLGGSFERLGGRSRPNLGAVDARTGRVTPWKPAVRPADYVEAVLFAHGEVLAGGHDGFAAYDSQTGRSLRWAARVQGTANRFAASGNTVYLGGNIEDGFTGAGDRLANNLAAVRLPAGRFTFWRPSVNRYVMVDTLAVSGRTVLVGGVFGQSLSC